MATPADPRSYVESKPVSSFTHKGLQIAARNATVYTCNVPSRQHVAKQNYLRRSHQMKNCGYNSVSYKPFETVGKVYLDNKNLILIALGQKDENAGDGEKSISKTLPAATGILEAEDDAKTSVVNDHNQLLPESKVQFFSLQLSEKLENIQTQLAKGRKLVNAVRLGCNLFRLLKEDQIRKADRAEMERRTRLNQERQSMKILSPTSSDDEDDKEEPVAAKDVTQELMGKTRCYKDDERPLSHSEACECGSQSLQSKSPNSNKSHLPLSDTSTSSLSTNSPEWRSPRLKKKLRSSVRPYSAVYSNISHPEQDGRENLFRQLCALNWILDAMSQDTFPPAIPSLSGCWNLRELHEDGRSSRRKMERQRQTEANWQTLLVNPGRFSQRDNRKLTRKISVHPHHIQRLSAVTSSSSAAGQKTFTNDHKARSGSCTSTNPETYATEITTGESERVPSEIQHPLQNEEIKKTAESVKSNANSSNKGLETNVKTPKHVSAAKSFIMTSNSTNGEMIYSKIRSKRLSQKQVNRLCPSQNPSRKAESRVRAWVRQTRHPKIVSDTREVNSAASCQTIPGKRISKTRYVTATLTAFSSMARSNSEEHIPSEMRKRFSEVTEENKISLNDKLEVQNRKRWDTIRRKFISLDLSMYVRGALEKMRKDVSFTEPETREEMRQRVSKECKWYKELINSFPDEIKCDPYIGIILNKIARHGSLEGRKTSASHFLKVLAILRTWELCSPDIAAAIEFVREKIVGFSTVEYDDWLSSKQCIRQRSTPAPAAHG